MTPLLFALALAAEPGVVTPSPVRAVVSATPFVLDVPYRSDWRADRPEVRAGTLLVLDVDPAALVVRDGPSPVLYVGASPAEVLARDIPAGRVTVVVPGALGPDVFAYFAAGDRLPDRVTPEEGARTLADATAAGVAPLRVPAGATARAVRDIDALEALATAK